MSGSIDLSSARDLIRWAIEDIQEFDSGVEAYFASDPYTPFIEEDPEGRYEIRKFRVAPIPDRLRKLASHALWDLKHALDHATYAAILAVTGAPPKDTYFPVASHPNDLRAKLTHANGKYPAALHKLFRGFEPYPTGDGYSGGDDVFVALNKMANTSKHAIVLRPNPRAFVQNFRSTAVKMLYPQPLWDDFKHEFTLGIFWKGAEVHMEADYASFIEFGEVEALEGHPAGDVLEGFGKAVAGVVDDFEAEVTTILAARG